MARILLNSLGRGNRPKGLFRAAGNRSAELHYAVAQIFNLSLSAFFDSFGSNNPTRSRDFFNPRANPTRLVLKSARPSDPFRSARACVSRKMRGNHARGFAKSRSQSSVSGQKVTAQRMLVCL
jgi:hypothetical protein